MEPTTMGWAVTFSIKQKQKQESEPAMETKGQRNGSLACLANLLYQ
jgi:hypothetical protein